MKVEIKPIVLKTPVRTGKNTYLVDQAYDQARVFVDGDQVGLTMTDPTDKYYKILHPLSKGFPREFLELVVKNSNGQLLGTLNGPKPAEPEEKDEEEGDDE